MDITYQTYLHRISSFFILLIGCCGLSKAAATPLDSIGVKYENGKKIVIHQLEAKETYFGLSRHYGISVKQIIAANGNKALKVGDTVHIPMDLDGSVTAATTPVGATQSLPAQPPVLAQGEYTAYKVGKGETLFTISKRFIISVESIRRANGLTGDSLTVDQILKIPNKELPPPPPKINEIMLSDTVNRDSEEKNVEIPANRYGIREMTEKGVGVWIDDLNQEGGSMLALHKTAPIGTVIKITNPMTNRTTFAKVVGKFSDSAETQNAIVVISKSAASLIGVLDRRFQVEIAYGAPNDGN